MVAPARYVTNPGAAMLPRCGPATRHVRPQASWPAQRPQAGEEATSVRTGSADGALTTHMRFRTTAAYVLLNSSLLNFDTPPTPGTETPPARRTVRNLLATWWVLYYS